MKKLMVLLALLSLEATARDEINIVCQMEHGAVWDFSFPTDSPQNVPFGTGGYANYTVTSNQLIRIARWPDSGITKYITVERRTGYISQIHERPDGSLAEIEGQCEKADNVKNKF
ncbi:hypothetical protein N9L28_03685 [Luminiphilus sp.]|nr:hypothetical protein [Luminiphilus sp.]